MEWQIYTQTIDASLKKKVYKHTDTFCVGKEEKESRSDTQQ